MAGSSSSKTSSQSSQSDGGSEPALGAVKSVCENSCAGFANNGVCDEGRPNVQATAESLPDSAAVFEVQCDLGTDCADCGPWVRLLVRCWHAGWLVHSSSLLWHCCCLGRLLLPLSGPPPAWDGLHISLLLHQPAACRCTPTQMPRTAGGRSPRSEKRRSGGSIRIWKLEGVLLGLACRNLACRLVCNIRLAAAAPISGTSAVPLSHHHAHSFQQQHHTLVPFCPARPCHSTRPAALFHGRFSTHNRTAV